MPTNTTREIALIGKITPKPRRLDRLAKHILIKRLEHLQHGTLQLIEGESSHSFGSKSTDSSLEDIALTLVVNNSAFYGEVVFGGSIGAGEA